MKTPLYASWRDVPPGTWPWPHFRPSELACRGTGQLMVDTEAMDKLEALRRLIDAPMVINSGYRSPVHNREVNGAPRSKHMEGIAFDVRMEGHDPHRFIAAAREVGFTGVGTYPHLGFVHIDTGPERSWGDPFPPDDDEDHAPPPPALPRKITLAPPPKAKALPRALSKFWPRR